MRVRSEEDPAAIAGRSLQAFESRLCRCGRCPAEGREGKREKVEKGKSKKLSDFDFSFFIRHSFSGCLHPALKACRQGCEEASFHARVLYNIYIIIKLKRTSVRFLLGEMVRKRGERKRSDFANADSITFYFLLFPLFPLFIDQSRSDRGSSLSVFYHIDYQCA